MGDVYVPFVYLRSVYMLGDHLLQMMSFFKDVLAKKINPFVQKCVRQ